MLPFFIACLLLILSFSQKWLTKSGLFSFALLMAFLLKVSDISFWGSFVLFFATSYFLRFLQKATFLPENPYEEKGSQRDGWQIFCNSFPTLLFLLLNFLTEKDIFLFMALGALATAYSDTVASELGRFSKGATYTLLGKKVPAGLSGGLSGLGTVGSFLASFFLVFFFALLKILFFQPVQPTSPVLLLICGFSGFFGNLTDSFLGIFQGKFKTSTGALTEKKTSQLVSGKPFLRNDGVNLVSGLTGGLIAGLVIFWWF